MCGFSRTYTTQPCSTVQGPPIEEWIFEGCWNTVKPPVTTIKLSREDGQRTVINSMQMVCNTGSTYLLNTHSTSPLNLCYRPPV